MPSHEIKPTDNKKNIEETKSNLTEPEVNSLMLTSGDRGNSGIPSKFTFNPVNKKGAKKRSIFTKEYTPPQELSLMDQVNNKILTKK